MKRSSFHILESRISEEPGMPSTKGRPLLPRAAQSTLAIGIRDNDVAWVDRALRRGASLHSSHTPHPLIDAVKRWGDNAKEVVEVLLKAGADVNARDKFNRTALSYCVDVTENKNSPEAPMKTTQGWMTMLPAQLLMSSSRLPPSSSFRVLPELLDILVNAEASIQIPVGYLSPSLHSAWPDENATARYLLFLISLPGWQGSVGGSDREKGNAAWHHVLRYLDNGVSPEITNIQGETLMFGLVNGNHPEFVPELVARGVPLDIPRADGLTVMDYAASVGNLRMQSALEREVLNLKLSASFGGSPRARM